MERCSLKQTSGQRNDGVAILKAIAAFMVVWIHLGVHGVGNPAVYAVTKYADALCRMAVPVFFIITGYFFSGYMDRTWPKLRNLLTLTVTASAVYILLDRWIGGEYRNLISETHWIPRFLIYNTFPPVAGHLWYMYAVLYAIPAVVLIRRFAGLKALYAVALALYICGLCLNYTEYSYMVRSWLFMGIPNVVIGIILRESSFEVKPGKLMWMCVMGQVLVIAEVYMRGQLGLSPAGNDVYVASSFAAASSFLLMCKYNFGGAKCVNM